MNCKRHLTDDKTSSTQTISRHMIIFCSRKSVDSIEYFAANKYKMRDYFVIMVLKTQHIFFCDGLCKHMFIYVNI